MPGRRDIVADYSAEAQQRIAANESIEEYNENHRRVPGYKPIKTMPLTPTEYMLKHSAGNNKVVYRGVEYESSYSNADSARRAFTKLRRGEKGTTGERIYARGQEFVYRNKKQGVYTAPPRGQYTMGMWLIRVTYIYTDEDGNQIGPVTKSFVAEDRSGKFDSMFSTGEMGGILDEAISEKMAEWTHNGSDASEDYVILLVDPVRIQTTTKYRNYRVPM